MAFHYKPPNSKTWRIGYWDGVAGKQKSFSAKTRIEAEAKRKTKEFAAQQQLGINQKQLINNPSRTIKLSDAIKLFISQRKLKSSSVRAYELAVETFIKASGDKFLFQYSNLDNISFIKQLNEMTRKSKENKEIPISQNTRANYTRHLFAFFAWLHKNKFIDENFIQKLKGERKEVRSIPQEHQQLIYNQLKESCLKKNYDLLKLKYYGAYRVEELLQTKVEDFDFKNDIVLIKNFKGNRIDKIPMVKDIKEHLLQMKLPATGRITFLSYSGIRSVWRRVVEKLNLEYTLHQIRKSRGTDLANNGVSPFFLHKFMRHENMNTTLKYYVQVDLKKMEDEINQKLTENLTEKSSKSTVKYGNLMLKQK